MQDGKHVILCVDDDPDFLASIRLVLEANGYVMAEAANAEEAIKVYEEASPDLLMIDLMMEEMDSGAGLIEEFKLLGNTAPVYLLSSVGDGLAAVPNYLELDLAGVFEKPIGNDVLLQTLKTKLEE